MGVAFLGIVPLFWLITWLLVPKPYRSRVLKRDVGKCSNCGYDLQGLADRAPCPECGSGSRGRFIDPLATKTFLRFAVLSIAGALVLGLTVAVASESDNFLGAIGVANIFYIFAMAPWLAFLMFALNSRRCHEENIIAIGIANFAGMLGMTVLGVPLLRESMGILSVSILASAVGSIFALIAAGACRYWES